VGQPPTSPEGKWTLGLVSFGSAGESDDTLVPIEAEIGLVKEIFHLLTRRRLGCRAVATRLNERVLWRRCARCEASTETRARLCRSLPCGVASCQTIDHPWITQPGKIALATWRQTGTRPACSVAISVATDPHSDPICPPPETR
jgi:hypothetical protein